jgi:hypothetical protein
LLAGVLLVPLLAQHSAAQEMPAASEPQAVDRDDDAPRIQLSNDSAWVGKLLLVIGLGLFIPAAVIGPWIRRHRSGQIPELHAGEERSPLTASQHEAGHGQ